MKLHQDTPDGLHLVQRYDASGFLINGNSYASSVIISPEGVVAPWAAGFEQFDAAAMQSVLALKPVIVLIGTGNRQQFPVPALLRHFVEAGVGWEVMDTGSACRTYNILAGEGRKVVAALLPIVG